MIFTTERQEGLALVTINRPPVNAISPEFISELRTLVDALAADDTVRAILFRSAIPGKFLAGADLSGVLQDQGGEEVLADRIRRLNREWRRAFDALENLPHPTIAAISGHCLGGGLEFALACDFRLMVADRKSTIGLTEVGVGLFPGAGGTQRLPRLVGVARAKAMIYQAQRLLASEALAIGLVHEVYGPEEFDRQALAFAGRMAQGPTVALRAAKAAIQAGLNDPALGDRLEEDGFVRVVQTEDALEGLSAFWAKRPPEFKGR